MTTSTSGYDVTPLGRERVEALAAGLSAEERQVILAHGTERPFCGTLLNNKSVGVYACRLCGLPLFRSDAKFESGTGCRASPALSIRTMCAISRTAGHGRVEIRCARCDGHLGHVFDDGPPPEGQRYCLNSVSMVFHEDEAAIEQHEAA
jgi:peptide-methionine (R)-S-oxide reductase